MPDFHKSGPRPEMPIDVGGELAILVADKATNMNYSIRVFPAANNEELGNAGLPLKFYFCPDRVSLAAHPDGNYKFTLLTYQGEFSENANAGVSANASLAGGLCTFTSTLRIPEAILKQMETKLSDKISGDEKFNSHKLFKSKTQSPASSVNLSLIPVTIVDAQVLMHNIDLSKVTPEETKNALGKESFVFDVQGNGQASTSYTGENAFTVTMGMTDAALLQGAILDGGKTPMTVQYDYKYKIAASAYKITIAADWKSVFNHFSSQFKAENTFTAIDIQKVMETLRKTGVIKVAIEFDEEFMDKDQQNFMRTHKEEILNKFIDLGTRMIFEQQPPNVDPAQAKDKTSTVSLGFGIVPSISFELGASYAMKKEHVEFSLDLTLEESEQKIIRRSNVASGNFTEIREVVQKEAEKTNLYFSKIYLADAFRIVYVAAHATANWRSVESPGGDPLRSLSIQVGYPVTMSGKTKVTKAAARYIDPITGKLSDHETEATWTPSTKDRVYIFRFDLQEEIPVEEQQKIEVTRVVSFLEDPNVVINSLTMLEVTDNHNAEVRAESAGKFGVSLEMENSEVLTVTPHIKVLVTCQVEGMQDVIFQFDQKNALSRQTWNIWYAKVEDIKPIKYKVDAKLSGKTIFDKVLRWGTDWIDYNSDTADGVISVPFPEIPDQLRPTAEQYLNVEQPPVNV